MITKDETIEVLIEELTKKYNYSSSWFLFEIIPNERYFELSIERSIAGLPAIVKDFPEDYSIDSPEVFKNRVTYRELLPHEVPENLDSSPEDFKNQLSEDSKFILIQGLTEILYLKNLKEDFNLEPEKTFLSTKAIDTGVLINGVVPEDIARF